MMSTAQARKLKKWFTSCWWCSVIRSDFPLNPAYMLAFSSFLFSKNNMQYSTKKVRSQQNLLREKCYVLTTAMCRCCLSWLLYLFLSRSTVDAYWFHLCQQSDSGMVTIIWLVDASQEFPPVTVWGEQQPGWLIVVSVAVGLQLL